MKQIINKWKINNYPAEKKPKIVLYNDELDIGLSLFSRLNAGDELKFSKQLIKLLNKE